MDDNVGKSHFVCSGGCKGESDEVGAICENSDCPNFGMPMQACSCSDGGHGADVGAEEVKVE